MADRRERVWGLLALVPHDTAAAKGPTDSRAHLKSRIFPQGLLSQEARGTLETIMPDRPTADTAPDALWGITAQESVTAKALDGGSMIATTRSASLAWPTPNLDEIERIGVAGEGLVDLWEASPVRFDTPEPLSEQIAIPFRCASLLRLELLSLPNQTKEAVEGHAIEHAIYRSLPDEAVKGTTVDGKLGFRSLDNVGPRRFLVIETTLFATVA